MKLTKNCLLPWTFMQVHAGGMMQPCAVGPDTDLGDFILDYCQPLKRGERRDVLNNPGLRAVREGLLTGNLRPMCRRCFFMSDKLIPTEELRNKVKDFLRPRLPAGTDMDTVDLTRTCGLEEFAISFTNRCNLRCVYCVQSKLAGSNPYFKMDFPDEYIDDALEFIAAQKPKMLRTCVEGEATVHKRWREIFTRFHDKHPEIALRMTTNFSRKFSSEDFELLAKYTALDISIDTIDPDLYGKIRCNGNIELVKSNLEKLRDLIDQRSGEGPSEVTLHSVVSSLTWREQEKLADFAFSLGFGIALGNYEERANTVAFQSGMLRPLSTLSVDEQIEARDMIARIQRKAQQLTCSFSCQGGLFQHVNETAERQYNRFAPYDANPLYASFHAQHPKGSPGAHLDIFYDYDNIAYAGISLQPGQEIDLSGIAAKGIVLREVQRFKAGSHSTKYEQTVLPQYRRAFPVQDGKLHYKADATNENIVRILLCCEEWW